MENTMNAEVNAVIIELLSMRIEHLFPTFDLIRKAILFPGYPNEIMKYNIELEQAFLRAKKSDKTYLISIKTHGYEWLEGTAFWESPTLEVTSSENNKKALEEHIAGKNKQRKGV